MKWLKTSLMLMLLFPLLACEAPEGAETLIRKQLDEIVAAVEAKDMDRFVRPIAADFSAERMDRRALRWLVFSQWQRHESIGVQLGDIHVEVHESVDPPRATVTFQALLSGGSLLPESVGWYSVKSGWREDTKENWRMISAQWEKKI